MTSATPERPRDLEALRALRAADARPDDAARADARARLIDRITEAEAERGGRAPAGRSRPRARTPRRWAVLALATVAVTAGAVGLGVGNGGGADPADGGSRLVSALAGVPTASAEDALRAAAAAAVGQRTLDFAPGTEWVVRTRSAEMLVGGANGLAAGDDPQERYAAVLSTTGTRWTTFDGHVRANSRMDGPLRFTSPRSQERYEQAGRPELWGGPPAGSKDGTYPIISGAEGAGTSFRFGRESLSYDDLLALPTDTAALRARVTTAAYIRDETGTITHGDDDFSRLRLIAELMVDAPLPPELRGALWRVVATLDDVKLVGPTTDPEGRPGVGITVSLGDNRTEVVYSRETGMLLSDWIYRTSPITTCDRDLASCDASSPKTDEQGRPYEQLAAPGTVAKGTTVLSAQVSRVG